MIRRPIVVTFVVALAAAVAIFLSQVFLDPRLVVRCDLGASLSVEIFADNKEELNRRIVRLVDDSVAGKDLAELRDLNCDVRFGW